jgi:CspA family cold shock protein
MTQDRSELRRVAGHVKWFDPVKGFGFVLDTESGPDILLHANVLRNFGQGSIADGAAIVVLAQTTPRGVQAVEVLEISAPEPDRMARIEDLEDSDPVDIAALPLEPARVKWFDKAKGFGFANVFGRTEDVFIHIEVLRQSGFSDLAPGEAVGLRVIEGKRGRMAAQVLAWEVAMRGQE